MGTPDRASRLHPTRSRRAALACALGLASLACLAATGCGSTESHPATTSSIPSRSIAPSTTSSPGGTAGPTTSAGSGAAVAGIDPALGVSTAVVTPSYQVVSSTFEGFRVYSYVPDDPTGVVYLFHGSGGSADFARKVETVDVLNTLVARGYGFVATESAERTGDKQWNMNDASPTSNLDLARLFRLRAHEIATTPVGPDTPTYGIGMSNGSAFVALWATASVKAGQPVAAIGMYMAGVTRATRAAGGVPVPTFMVVAANDTRTSPTKEKADLAEIARSGLATELHVVPERSIVASRYLRVPGIDRAMADAIVQAYETAHLFDTRGRLIVAPNQLGDVEQQKAAAKGVTLPSSLQPGQRIEVQNETKAMIAEHQFNAEFKIRNAEFFDAHR